MRSEGKKGMTLIGWSVCWNDSVVARLGLLCGRND